VTGPRLHRCTTPVSDRRKSILMNSAKMQRNFCRSYPAHPVQLCRALWCCRSGFWRVFVESCSRASSANARSNMLLKSNDASGYDHLSDNGVRFASLLCNFFHHNEQLGQCTTTDSQRWTDASGKGFWIMLALQQQHTTPSGAILHHPNNSSNLLLSSRSQTTSSGNSNITHLMRSQHTIRCCRSFQKLC
jgi:hypothetical protein